MKVEHFALDGSSVSIEAEADLNLPVTSTGWAVSPALLRAHPFSTHPAGYSDVVEKAVRGGNIGLKVVSEDQFSMKDGRLRVAVVQLPMVTGGERMLTVGAWEGRGGCLTTSISGQVVKKLVEVFDTLAFSTRGGSLVVDSRVVPLPRAPQVIKEIPGLGIVAIRPAIPSEMEQVPRATGFRTEGGGELFRFRQGRAGMLFVGSSALAQITPVARGRGSTESESEAAANLVKIARGLKVEWTPRAA